jgi:hypothetical protein
VNPIVCALLRSRSHRVLSGSLLLLGYTGRLSGRDHALPVMYAPSGGDLVVVAGEHATKSWWRNFGSDPQPVRVVVRGASGNSTARRLGVDSDDRRSALQAYRQRFPKVVLDPAAPVVLVAGPVAGSGQGTDPRPEGSSGGRPDVALGEVPPRPRGPMRLLVGLELFTGGTALIGGLLLAIAPDGSLLAADPAALHGSPFTDYRLPGVLLATLVGGGYLLTGSWQRRAGRGARGLSVFAGAGLVLFEGAEVLWLGYQPLEAVFAAVGVTVAGLALMHRPENPVPR